MLFEREFSGRNICSVTLFFVGVAVAVADLFVVSNDIGHIGIILTIGAAWMHVIGGQHRMRERERRAYELGRETNSSSGVVQLGKH